MGSGLVGHVPGLPQSHSYRTLRKPVPISISFALAYIVAYFNPASETTQRINLERETRAARDAARAREVTSASRKTR